MIVLLRLITAAAGITCPQRVRAPISPGSTCDVCARVHVRVEFVDDNETKQNYLHTDNEARYTHTHTRADLLPEDYDQWGVSDPICMHKSTADDNYICYCPEMDTPTLTNGQQK